MTNYRSVFGLNGLFFLLAIALIFATKLFGSSASLLFTPPAAPSSLDDGLLTHTFQILSAASAVACIFSWGLLRKIKSNQITNSFLFYSAIITTGFLLNEVFRIHIMLLQVGIPKIFTITIYAISILVYGFSFRRKLLTTPYLWLLTGLGLLFFAIAIDSLHLGGNPIPIFLEGIPKIISQINITIYFWQTCHQEILKVMGDRA
jgi:hypothetical protein